MRRAISSFLLALLSFPLIAQAFAASPAQLLPACCRRAGAHHCAMPSPAAHTHSGPQLALSPCSQFPQSSVVSQSIRFSSPPDAQHADPTQTLALVAQPLIDFAPGSAILSSIRKRGPPSLVN
jgi:hypothetical protein